MAGRKSGSISKTAPPGRALATRFTTAASASATWCSTARAVTRSKPPGSTGPARMSARRSSSPGTSAAAKDRSRSTATARPPGAIRPASQADTEPLPQPTSSVRVPNRRPAAQSGRGASDRATSTSSPAARARLLDDDQERILASPTSPARDLSQQAPRPLGTTAYALHFHQLPEHGRADHRSR